MAAAGSCRERPSIFQAIHGVRLAATSPFGLFDVLVSFYHSLVFDHVMMYQAHQSYKLAQHVTLQPQRNQLAARAYLRRSMASVSIHVCGRVAVPVIRITCHLQQMQGQRRRLVDVLVCQDACVPCKACLASLGLCLWHAITLTALVAWLVCRALPAAWPLVPGRVW